MPRPASRLLLALVLAGCASTDARHDPDDADNDMRLDSTAFMSGQPIPTKYTCEGDDVSPTLHWSHAPAATRSFALVVDDPDAPDPAKPEREWVHWLLYDLPPTTGDLAEAIAPERLPTGTRQGKNDWGAAGWRGPCPPIGRHRYRFTVYALDTTLTALDAPDRKQLDAAMKGHVLAQGQLVGTYEKQRKAEPEADAPAE